MPPKRASSEPRSPTGRGSSSAATKGRASAAQPGNQSKSSPAAARQPSDQPVNAEPSDSSPNTIKSTPGQARGGAKPQPQPKKSPAKTQPAPALAVDSSEAAATVGGTQSSRKRTREVEKKEQSAGGSGALEGLDHGTKVETQQAADKARPATTTPRTRKPRGKQAAPPAEAANEATGTKEPKPEAQEEQKEAAVVAGDDTKKASNTPAPKKAPRRKQQAPTPATEAPHPAGSVAATKQPADGWLATALLPSSLDTFSPASSQREASAPVEGGNATNVEERNSTADVTAGVIDGDASKNAPPAPKPKRGRRPTNAKQPSGGAAGDTTDVSGSAKAVVVPAVDGKLLHETLLPPPPPASAPGPKAARAPRGKKTAAAPTPATPIISSDGKQQQQQDDDKTAQSTATSGTAAPAPSNENADQQGGKAMEAAQAASTAAKKPRAPRPKRGNVAPPASGNTAGNQPADDISTNAPGASIVPAAPEPSAPSAPSASSTKAVTPAPKKARSSRQKKPTAGATTDAGNKLHDQTNQEQIHSASSPGIIVARSPTSRVPSAHDDTEGAVFPGEPVLSLKDVFIGLIRDSQLASLADELSDLFGMYTDEDISVLELQEFKELTAMLTVDEAAVGKTAMYLFCRMKVAKERLKSSRKGVPAAQSFRSAEKRDDVGNKVNTNVKTVLASSALCKVDAVGHDQGVHDAMVTKDSDQIAVKSLSYADYEPKQEEQPVTLQSTYTPKTPHIFKPFTLSSLEVVFSAPVYRSSGSVDTRTSTGKRPRAPPAKAAGGRGKKKPSKGGDPVTNDGDEGGSLFSDSAASTYILPPRLDFSARPAASASQSATTLNHSGGHGLWHLRRNYPPFFRNGAYDFSAEVVLVLWGNESWFHSDRRPAFYGSWFPAGRLSTCLQTLSQQVEAGSTAPDNTHSPYGSTLQHSPSEVAVAPFLSQDIAEGTLMEDSGDEWDAVECVSGDELIELTESSGSDSGTESRGTVVGSDFDVDDADCIESGWIVDDEEDEVQRLHTTSKVSRRGEGNKGSAAGGGHKQTGGNMVQSLPTLWYSVSVAASQSCGGVARPTDYAMLLPTQESQVVSVSSSMAADPMLHSDDSQVHSSTDDYDLFSVPVLPPSIGGDSPAADTALSTMRTSVDAILRSLADSSIAKAGTDGAWASGVAQPISSPVSTLSIPPDDNTPVGGWPPGVSKLRLPQSGGSAATVVGGGQRCDGGHAREQSSLLLGEAGKVTTNVQRNLTRALASSDSVEVLEEAKQQHQQDDQQLLHTNAASSAMTSAATNKMSHILAHATQLTPPSSLDNTSEDVGSSAGLFQRVEATQSQPEEGLLDGLTREELHDTPAAASQESLLSGFTSSYVELPPLLPSSQLLQPISNMSSPPSVEPGAATSQPAEADTMLGSKTSPPPPPRRKPRGKVAKVSSSGESCGNGGSVSTTSTAATATRSRKSTTAAPTDSSSVAGEGSVPGAPLTRRRKAAASSTGQSAAQ